MANLSDIDLNSPDWKEKSIEWLKNRTVKELYDFCYDQESSKGFPIVFFDETSTKNLEKKKRVLIRMITGEITEEEEHDKEVFELIPDNLDEIIFN